MIKRDALVDVVRGCCPVWKDPAIRAEAVG
jgi:hypothetical protein